MSALHLYDYPYEMNSLKKAIFSPKHHLLSSTITSFPAVSPVLQKLASQLYPNHFMEKYLTSSPTLIQIQMSYSKVLNSSLVEKAQQMWCFVKCLLTSSLFTRQHSILIWHQLMNIILV